MRRAAALARWTGSGLRYRPWRALFAAGTVGAAMALVALTLGFQAGYERALARNVEALGYQVLVTGKGCPHEAATLILRGGSIPMYLSEEVARHVEAQPEVAESTRFLLQAVPESAGATLVCLGVDAAFVRLRPNATLQRGKWFADEPVAEAVLGFAVAEHRRLDLGDEIAILGRPHRVVGVLDQLGTQDDGTVFLPLARAQQIFERPDRLTGIGVRLHDLEEAGPFMDRMYEVPSVQVVRLSQVQETVLGVLRGVRALLLAFSAAALSTAGVGVLGVALLTWSERGGELGLLRALGCPARTLFALAWVESLAAGVLGVVAGGVLAFLIKGAAESFVRESLSFVPAGAVIALSAPVLAKSALAVLGVALLAAVGPAWRAAANPPAATMRGSAP